jgi:hypothetical protein
MKMPVKPPSQDEMHQDFTVERFRAIMERVQEPSVRGRYRHWDELRHLTPPQGLTHLDWWFGLKPRRQGSKSIPLTDKSGANFAFNMVDPLPESLRSMILHFWLAYDHPFVDGNGRPARALFYWSMLKQGYWLFEFITISKILLIAPAKYAEAFLYSETDDNDLTYFLLYHANIIRRAIDELYKYIDRHTKQLNDAEKELRGFTFLNHRQRELISHALRHPGQRYTIESHRNSHRVVYETARSDLMNLADRKLIQKRKIGRTWFFTPSGDLTERLRQMK